MEHQSRLFSGLPLAKKQAEKLYSDLSKLHKRRGFAISRADTSAQQFLSARGKVFVQMMNDHYAIPVIIFLQFPGFPLAPPTVKIDIGAGVQIQPSQVCGYDGTIPITNVIHWSMEGSIYDVVSSLVPFFQRWSVLTPQSMAAVRVDTASFVRFGLDEAAHRVARLQKLLNEQALVENEEKRTKRFRALVREQRATLESCTRVYSAPTSLPDSSDYSVSPNVDEEVRACARDSALFDVIQGLKAGMRSGAISLDEMVRVTRQISRDHFLSQVLPML